MTDWRDQELNAGPARRAQSSIGDRLAVLLAGSVLAAGLLIAIANGVQPGPDDAFPTASPSARNSEHPAPSSSVTPRRSLGLIVVAPGEPPAVNTEADSFWRGWIRAREELELRIDPSEGADVVGSLAAGEIAFATARSPLGAVPGASPWLFVEDPDPVGWVRVARGTTPLVDRYDIDLDSIVPELSWLSGGLDGFVASGYVGDPRDGGNSWLVASGDGRGWSRSDGATPTALGPVLAADGPAGWLALSPPYPPTGRSSVWLYASADRTHWTVAGSLDQEGHNLYPDALYGSERGYLLASRDGAWRQYWFSTDGRSWLEMPRPDFLTPLTEIREAATPIGFYAWDAQGGQGAYSPDGARWEATDSGPVGEVVGMGDTLLGVDNDPGGSGIRVWLGRPEPDAFAWTRDAGAEAILAGSALALLVADGERAVAVTVDFESEVVRAWTSRDGRDWTPLQVPGGGFGVIPHQAASSSQVTVVVGREDHDGIQLPVLWRLVGDTWDAVPYTEVVSRPIPAVSCPEPPADVLDFLLLNRGLASRCLGDRSMSFPAYVVARHGGDDELGEFTPDWLGGRRSLAVSLSPYEANWNGGSAVLDPTVAASLDVRPGWYQVTGHFNDQASASCRQAWSVDTLRWYLGREDVVRQCRETFVITEASPLPGH